MSFYRPPTTQETLEALGALYRAVRAWKFYPNGHPSRRSSLSLAHAAMRQLLDGNTLSLACGRTGFSFPDGEFLKDASGMSAGLAYELFIRRVQKITFMPDLYEEDVVGLFTLLSLSPEQIYQSGGMDVMMAERGIRSIWVNEFDLAAIRRRREQVEQAGIIPPGIDESETADDADHVIETESPRLDELLPEKQLQMLLGRIATCEDDDIYLMLVRQAVACVDILQMRQEPHTLFLLIDLLAGHARDLRRSGGMRECAQFAIEQIVTTGDILNVALEQMELDADIPAKALQAVFKAGGERAVTSAIELMGRTTSLKTRKNLSILLGGLGEAALPALLNLVNDSRWFITRNICAILGTIASRQALAAVAHCLHHADLRVRKEAIRSLAQIGGEEAESAILDVLRTPDTVLYPRAIATLGGMKSKKSLIELLRIVTSSDLFLKNLSLKIDALTAIAAIGDRQVTPLLVMLMEERHLLAAARGRQLKSAIAACLGKLGDARAIPVLEKFSSGSGELASACAEAVRMIEKIEGRPDGNS